MLNRFLACAAAVAAVFAAAPTASADECHLSWDIPCCPVDGTDVGIANVTLTICNCSDFASDYAWTFPPAPPLSFSPAMGTVFLEPGECADIPITITCPGDIVTPGNGVEFSAVVKNASTGISHKCTGSIRNTDMVKATPTPPTVTVDTDGTFEVGVLVSNTSDDPVVWDPTIEVMPATTDLRVQPMQPMNIPPRTSIRFEVAVDRIGFSQGRDHEPFVFYDIILSWDQDGDGEVEPGSSVAVRSVRSNPCAADLDGDGVIGSGDLAILLAGWGPCL